MKKIILQMVLLCCLCSQNITAQYSYNMALPYEEPVASLPENLSPAETAYNEYSDLTSLENSRGDLRARPSDLSEYDKPQKIPLGNVSWLMTVIALMMYVLYKRFVNMKKSKEISVDSSGTSESISPQKTILQDRKGKKSFSIFNFQFSIFIVLLFCTTAAFAQTPQAVPDNYFVKPGVNSVFNVLQNDNLGAYTSTPEDVDVTIMGYTSLPAATQTLAVQGQSISLTALPNFSGQIQIQYRITCGADVSTSYAYITVADAPEFISTAECTVPPEAFNWTMKRLGLTSVVPEGVPTGFVTPLVGDLDGDGSVEIVCSGAVVYTNASGIYVVNQSFTDRILIYNKNLVLEKVITVPTGDGYVQTGLALADVNNDGQAEIIYASGYKLVTPTANTGMAHGTVPTAAQLLPADQQYRLFAFHKDGTQVWKSSAPFMEESKITTAHGYSGTPVVADIDGDGKTVEVYCGDRVFAGENGDLLATLPAGGRGQRYAASSTWIDGYRPAIGDINGDGIQEICGGPTTYQVKISSRTMTNNPVTIVGQLTGEPDGYTALADINRDGITDVVTVGIFNKPGDVIPAGTVATTARMYVWSGVGTTGNKIGNTVLATTERPPVGDPEYVNTSQGNTGSPPFCGDITGDGYADIAYSSYAMVAAYEYNPGTNTFTRLFRKKTTDTSAATSMSMFDFNLDGEVELVYRDQDSLRVMDKTGTNKITYPVGSGTHIEYPTIADIDNDNHAEILVSGWDRINMTAPAGWSSTQLHRIQVFASNTTPNNWAPARKVWNQYSYNPTLINEDLTVPAKPINMATKVLQPDGTVLYPFNNFQQQTGPVNSYGEPLQLAPDLTFQPGTPIPLTIDAVNDKMKVSGYITNSGLTDYSGSVELSIYCYDQSALAWSRKGGQVWTAQTIADGENKTYEFEVTGYAALMASLPANSQWYVVINLQPSGTNAPVQPAMPSAFQEECNYTNNMTALISFVSGYTVLCQGESGQLSIFPAGMFDCYWYKSDGTPYKGPAGTDATNIGDVKQVTKTSGSHIDYFLIDAYMKGTSNKVSLRPDTVFVYQAADSLVWQGAENTDWNNPNNWYNPAYTTADRHRQGNVPIKCTNVLIPVNNQSLNPITLYPDLTQGTSIYGSGEKYANVACNNIYFEHGGEVFRSDKLSYDSAHVEVNMQSNLWYCFAPPLRGLYSGDIYLNDANPFNDNMYVWTRRYSQTEPQHGTYVAGNWGRAFNTPDVLFHAGEGLGVWLDKFSEPSLSTHTDTKMWYPKSDAAHYIYSNGAPVSSPFATDRTYSHRFIFEETINAGTGNVTLYPEAPTAGSAIMIGNPYMANLDFDKFYAANSGRISNYYRVLSNGSISTYYITGGTSTGGLTNLIAPMQAIMLNPATTFASNTLVVNSDMTETEPGNTLRSAPAEPIESLLISLSNGDDRRMNRTALLLRPELEATLAYNEAFDVYKMFLIDDTEAMNVYLLTDENFYMDIKNVSNLDGLTFRIGYQTNKTGVFALGFEKIWEFADGYEVLLTDKYLSKTVDLRMSSIYTFEKTTSDTFTDDHFELKFVRQGTGIETETLTPAVTKTVVSKSYYDLSGRPVSEYAAKGFLIQKSVYDDGSVGFSKVYVR